MKYVLLLPFVHSESYDRMVATLHQDVLDSAACVIVLDNTAHNRGCAASRNVGVRAMFDYDADWVIDVSPVTRFGPAGGRDFVESVAANDSWVVQSSTPVNWHCIAWSRRMHERVGLWDENFWPIYGEDGDMSRRIHLAMAEDPPVGSSAARWDCVDTDAWITMHGHAAKLAGVWTDHERMWQYYVAKWNGRSGEETHVRPFGLDVGLDWWPSPPHALAWPHKGWE